MLEEPHTLGQWKTLCRCLGNGVLEINNYASERVLREIAVGRKNFMLHGSDAGGRRAAIIYSRRVLETVRAKMRRLGLIDHVSRFNKKYGYREGWVFSSKFSHALQGLADLSVHLREKKGPNQERKDRDCIDYL